MNHRDETSVARGSAFVLAAFLTLHGVVHLFGFTATWHIGTGTLVADAPTLVSVGPGSSAAHVLGLLWLVVGVAFIVSALMLVLHRATWRRWVAVAALLSLVLCILWWRDAPAGAVIDALLLAGVALQRNRGRGHHGRGTSTAIPYGAGSGRTRAGRDGLVITEI